MVAAKPKMFISHFQFGGRHTGLLTSVRSKNIRRCFFEKLDPENVAIATGIAFPSHPRAEI